MKYLRFDPSTCGFPQLRASVLPTLSMGSLRLSNSGPLFLSTSPDRVRHFARGRYALTQAYLQAGVGRNGALLAPAYHCRTMLDPAIRIGANVELYPVRQDLSPDVDGLKDCLNRAIVPVKALLVPHYFGFAQNLAPLAEFCADHELAMIEDCSHAFVGAPSDSTATQGPIGTTGRYCVASPYKFFPSADGGLLWSNGLEGLAPIKKSRPGLKQEVKGLVQTIQKALVRAQPTDAGSLAKEITALSSAQLAVGRTIEEVSAGASDQYHLGDEDQQGFAVSRWIFRHSDAQTLVRRRRENYQAWLDGPAGLPHCQALFPSLPSDCVPYMFPLQLDHPQVHFFALKQLGVPIWRWDDMAASGCRVASNFRLKLLHLPCHQGLSSKQMEWMIAAVSQVLSVMAIPKTS